MTPTLIYSNRLEVLADHLKNRLFVKGSFPFLKRVVVVPSAAMKSWLWQKLAIGDKGIVAGIEAKYLNQMLYQFVEIILNDETPLLPTPLGLALAIEKEIRAKIDFFDKMTEEKQKEWEPLFNYLKLETVEQKPLKLSRKGYKRLVALSSQLASLFNCYGEYGSDFLPLFESEKGWQQELWRSIYFKNEWSYPYKLFDSAINKMPYAAKKLQHRELHIFGLSYISPIHLSFLTHLASTLPITFYTLSPCASYWGDLCSDRDFANLKNSGVKEGSLIQESLDLFLKDRNVLLGNIGKLGRIMSLKLQIDPIEIFESYQLPPTIPLLPQYSEVSNPLIETLEEITPLTLLQALQADFLLLRNPQKSEKIDFLNKDTSIQIHTATTYFREIQILHEIIIGLIDKHSTSENIITPKDIVVMAPDISLYLPYIKQVFCQPGSFIDIQVYDLNLDGNSSLVAAYLKLIHLYSSRWEASSLLSLFEVPSFRRKHGLKREDIDQLKVWIDEQSIVWGYNGEHRQELLSRDHCRLGIAENYDFGTWERGLSQLLTDLVKNAEKKFSLTHSQIPLLEKWLKLLISLRSDLQPLEDGSQMTLSDWSSYLICLLESYFAPDSKDEWEQLMDQLKTFGNEGQNSILSNGTFSFLTIKKHLEAILKDCFVTHQENHLQAVRFCSLLPMRAIPAKVVYLIGMEEENYPRHPLNAPFDLLKKSNLGNYYPSRMDYDRYLFLEAILSARNYLCFSYLDRSPIDGQKRPSSPLLNELLHYLDDSFLVRGKPPSETIVNVHPLFGFNKEYFSNEQGEIFRSYSQSNYQEAKAFYQIKKASNHCFADKIHLLSKDCSFSLNRDESIIDLSKLYQLARNPIKTYFHQSLGIYLNKDHEILPVDEIFSLSALDKYLWRMEGMLKPLNVIKETLQRKAILPPGIFGQVAFNQIIEDIKDCKAQLKEWKIKEEDIYQIHLQEGCDKATQIDEYNWHVPPIPVSYQEKSFQIIGTIPNVTPYGLLVHGKRTLSDIVKFWPQFLAYCDLSSLPFQKDIKLLHLKDGKSFSFMSKNYSSALKDYLDYYFIAKENLSPLMPEWIPGFLAKNPVQIEQMMISSFSKWQCSDDSVYLDFMFDFKSPPSSLPLLNAWGPYAEKLFCSLTDISEES